MSSSDSETATLHLRAAAGYDELTVVDGAFRPVAAGIGALTAVLEPGIYEVAARAGPSIARRLIRLAPGGVREEVAPAVSCPSTAPIPGFAGENGGLLALVRDATASVADRAGAGAGAGAALCVAVREMAPAGRGRVVDEGVLALKDSALHDVAEFGTGWRADDAGSATVWADLAKAGGYALRLGRAPDAVDLALWLPEGWTLVVFMAGDTPDVRARSVTMHLVRKGEAWSGGDDAVATELALWGLREGRQQAAEVALSAIGEDADDPNPFVDIAVTHLLLEGSSKDTHRVAALVDRLAAWAPEHPDVVALQLAAAQRGVSVERPARLPVAWPPMLLASYRALLRRDAAAVHAFAPGSVAERAAGSITAGSIWSTWRPVAPADRIPPRLSRTKVAPDRVLAKAARNPEKLRRSKSSDPATRRVAAYLSAVADLDDVDKQGRLASLSPAQISLATGLPTATVDLSLRRIWLSMAGLAILPLMITLSALVVALTVALSLGGFSAPPQPTVTPTPIPGVEPRIEVVPIEWPAIPIGVPVGIDMPLSNVGNAPLTILEFATAGEAAAEFGYLDVSCRQGPLNPGDQCVFRVTFTPGVVGERLAELWVETQEIGVVTIPLRGTGIASALQFEPSELVLAPEERAEVVMVPTGTIGIKSIELTGEDARAFHLETSCQDRVLKPGERCSIFVTQTSGGAEFAARVEVFTDDGMDWGVSIFGLQSPR